MKNVYAVTSTRADYGLLRPVILRLSNNKNIKLHLVVTGTHLLKEYGHTIDEIINDGLNIAYTVDIFKITNKTQEATAQIIATTIQEFAALFSKNRPDALLLLGDRYEIFAVASAASALSIPIAHISGGDVTQGAKDDFYRHCITHMSDIHFPSCQDSYNRLLRLGQPPERVVLSGGLGDENIRNMELFTKQELATSLNIISLDKFLLITYHPETQGDKTPEQDMKQLFLALEDFKDITMIFTKSNADTGAMQINSMIDDYCEKHKDNAYSFFSLGLKRYISAMKYAAAVVGNSSSGVVETPTLKAPCVNIGDRQKGRYIAENVIQTAVNFKEIATAIKKAMSMEFKQKAQQAKSPYFIGEKPSEIINDAIEEFVYSQNNIKKFYDGE